MLGREVREQIEQMDAQLQSMQQRVAYSTITVNLVAKETSAAVEPSAASKLGESWDAAVRAAKDLLLKLAGERLWIAAFSPYLASAGLMALAALRWKNRGNG